MRVSAFAPLEKAKQQSYITVLYLMFKLLNLLNTIGQLYVLNVFLGPEYKFWGYGILADLVEGREWHTSGHFPRVTFCDVSIREMGEYVVSHTFQCVLMINMLNEKIYIFIWFWLFGLMIVNAINLLAWVWNSFSGSSARNFVKTRLTVNDDQIDSDRLRRFVHDHLSRDGITILRLLDTNCGEMAVSSIINEMWDNVGNNEQQLALPYVQHHQQCGGGNPLAGETYGNV